MKSGKYYSVNVPLQEGIGDAAYETVHLMKDVVIDLFRCSSL